MSRFTCLCQSCRGPGPLYLYRRPLATVTLGQRSAAVRSVALCAGCGIANGFARWFS